MSPRRLRVAVVGVGSHGQHYARLCAASDEIELVAVVDPRAAWGRRVADMYGVAFHEDPSALVGQIDAACVVTPTVTHFSVVAALLRAGVHVLVEKPLCATLADARTLVGLADAGGLVLHVGYIERWNPAVIAAFGRIPRPSFITCQRSGPFSLRESAVSIVIDHMVHDLDLITMLDPSPVESIVATGVRVMTPHYDVVHAHLTFASGLRAALIMDRLCVRKLGLIGLQGEGAYVTVDCDAYELRAYERRGAAASDDGVVSPEERYARLLAESVSVASVTYPGVNQIAEALACFARAVREGTPELGRAATGAQALRSLAIAERVEAALDRRGEP